MKLLLFNIILFLFTAVSIYSQTIGSVGMSDARSMALGNEFTAISTGVYSIGKNPANLAFHYDHSVEVATVLPFPNVNAIGGTNFLSVEDFNYFFTENSDNNTNTNELIKRDLTVSDKQRLLALFSTDNRIHTNVSYTIFALSVYGGEYVGSFAFSIHDQAAVNSNIPKDIVDLALFGNQPGRVYDLSDAQLDAWVLRSYSLSYALDISNYFPLPFKSLNGGITLKYIQGFAHASLSKFNTSLVTDADTYAVNVHSEIVLHSAVSPDFGFTYDFEDSTKQSNITPFPKPVGSGIGVDIGFSSEINDRLTVGASVTDIGSLDWEAETVEYSSVTDFTLNDITEDEVVDSLLDTIIGDGQFIDGYSTGLSTAIHIGGSFKVGTLDQNNSAGILLITGGYHHGFNNLPGNSTNPRFTLGLEWWIANWFQLRTGTSFGGRDGFQWAFGFGLDASLLEFHFATSNVTGTFGSTSSKIYSVSIGTRWKF